MMTMEGMMDKGVLDDVIRRLLEGKGGKQVQLSESEIRQLCVNARQIFLSQPILLELTAPIRVCGQLFIFIPFLSFHFPYIVYVWFNCVSIFNYGCQVIYEYRISINIFLKKKKKDPQKISVLI